MKRSLFEHEMRKAQAFASLGERSDYWMGYQRGLRRRYHGTNFGTDQEHQLWQTATGDQSRDDRVAGYRDGYYGPCEWNVPSEAVRVLRRWREWSAAYLAGRLGRSIRTVQGWEQGRTVPPAALKSLHKLWLSDGPR